LPATVNATAPAPPASFKTPFYFNELRRHVNEKIDPAKAARRAQPCRKPAPDGMDLL
jgi:hypothetical protein